MATNFKINHLLASALPLFFLACAPQATKMFDEPGTEAAPINEPASEDAENMTPPPEVSSPLPVVGNDDILSEYDYVDPNRIVPTKALEQALLYYHENKSNLKNKKVLSIIDFSQSSTKKRWYIINMETGAVWNIHVAHGKGSDKDHDGFAEKFSNVPQSNTSSIGFYLTAETYIGDNDYSLKLDGLSETNSNARPRLIVVHGAEYVSDKEVIQGRSLGCPAVSLANTRRLIDLIKGGSIILAVN